MPGLKEAVLLACEKLKNSLAPHDCYPIPGIVGLWNHKHRPTMFSLCAGDFVLKVWSKEDAEYLCDAVGSNFRHTIDMEVKNYCGLTIDWQCELGCVDVSMPKRAPATLKKL